ncbi:MAG: HDIG domain-containing protein [Planctomycetes bacterium]|nr:HDIG domain-containing protein [Planctomycetota bacterium]
MKKVSRLGQWDGPRHSSRGHGSLLAGLAQRPALARVGVVFVATLAMTALAYCWGPPFPYRVGEVWAHDVRARVCFEVEDPEKTEDRQEQAIKGLREEQRNDPGIRERVRRSVPHVMECYQPGTVIVQRGQRITESHRQVLLAEARAYHRSLDLGERARRALALFLMMSLMAVLVVLYVARFQAKLAHNTPQIVKVCLLLVLNYLAWLILSRPPWHAGLVPLTASAMVLAIAYRPQFALMLCFSFSIVATASRGNGMDHLLVQVGGQAVAVLLMRNVRTRTQLLEVAAAAGIGYMAMTLTTALLTSQPKPMIYSDCGRRFVWGLLAGFLVTGCLPLIERFFGIVTDIRLLELADGSHPLLQELVRRAPGTYNHSLTVASLSENAAEAIGGNALLARVGSYFHDVGKMLKPAYFVENQNGHNLHDTLEPGLSTLIIIGHVKDGVALAEQYGLPQPVVDFIQQHHGTTLVEYFYRAALRIQAEAGNTPARQEGAPCPLEASFRYPGPKPQSREAGIVMLADAVESASRTLPDPSPGSLRKLVRDLLMKRLLDGQFEESGLTLTELHLIEETLCKGLTGMHHSRVKYPDPRDRRVA